MMHLPEVHKELITILSESDEFDATVSEIYSAACYNSDDEQEADDPEPVSARKQVIRTIANPENCFMHSSLGAFRFFCAFKYIASKKKVYKLECPTCRKVHNLIRDRERAFGVRGIAGVEDRIRLRESTLVDFTRLITEYSFRWDEYSDKCLLAFKDLKFSEDQAEEVDEESGFDGLFNEDIT
jgi:hypothetical protein